MIRWRFILTRVIIVVAVIAVLRYALGPVAKYVTVQAIQSATGARVEIDQAVVGLFPPSVRYEGLQIADPRDDKSMSNAVEIESMDLEIDGDAFLHRRYVIRDGRINGLKIGSDRLSSGHLDPQPEIEPQNSATSQWMSQFFGSLTDASREKLEAFGSELEMVKRSDQIRRRWKSEYLTLTQRAKQLEESIKQIRDSAKGIDNPLRDWPRIEAALAKSKEVQNELVAVRAAIDEIPSKVQADLISMQDAKQIDINRIEQITSLNLSNPENFGPRMLADLVNAQVDRIRGYVDTGREVANWTVAAPKAERQRGETFDLFQGKPAPSMLVRRCEINGELQADGMPYLLTGVLENLTHQPRLRDQPFHAKLKLEGPQTVRVDYLRDDSSTIVRETLTVHWPEIIAPDLKIGDSDSLALDMTDGRMELWAQLNATGDQLQGRLVSRRVGTTIGVQSNSKIAGSALVSGLKQSLASVDRVEIDAAFNGTWSDMNVSISSNLTQVFKTGMDQAVAAQVTATRNELASKLNETYQDQMADLQTFLAGEQTQARQLVAKADATIQELSAKVLSETGAADAYLGRLRGSLLK